MCGYCVCGHDTTMPFNKQSTLTELADPSAPSGITVASGSRMAFNVALAGRAAAAKAGVKNHMLLRFNAEPRSTLHFATSTSPGSPARSRLATKSMSAKRVKVTRGSILDSAAGGGGNSRWHTGMARSWQGNRNHGTDWDWNSEPVGKSWSGCSTTHSSPTSSGTAAVGEFLIHSSATSDKISPPSDHCQTSGADVPLPGSTDTATASVQCGVNIPSLGEASGKM